IYAGITLDRHHGGFFVSRDSGKTWTKYNQGLGTAVAGIRTILPSEHTEKVFLGTSQGVFWGVPERQDWKKIEATGKLVILDLAFADAGETSMYLATKQGLYHLDTEGPKLRQVEIPVYDREFYSVPRASETDMVFVGTDMGVFRSDDEDKTWTIKV